MSLLMSSDCLPHQVRQAMTGGFEDKEIAVQELSHAESLTEEARHLPKRDGEPDGP